MLCQQHGTVQFFNQNCATRHAVATFAKFEDALKAQHALNGYVIANIQLAADLIPDADFGKFVNLGEQCSSPLTGNIWSSTLGTVAAAIPSGQSPAWKSGIMVGGEAGSVTANCSLWNAKGCSNSVGGL